MGGVRAADAPRDERSPIAEPGARLLAVTLDALVPDFLPAVPIDPWSGKPLRYDPATGTVWSLGPNGVDEGGTAVPYDVTDPPDLAIRPAAAK